ncbi:MAG: hypothetical protein JXA57_04650, partial [Armatimonadetes bacterium]|nr:hypothetical protein [Armatimonadota bacterium]
YPGRAVLYGLAGFVLLPAAVVAEALVGTFLTVLLVITLVGILLIPAVWAGVVALCLVPLLLLLVGVIAVWLSLGKALAVPFSKHGLDRLHHLHPFWAALFGLVVVAVAARLPVVGGLVIFTLIILGFGLAVMTGFGADPEWAHKRLGFRTRPPSPGQPPPAPGTPPSEEMQDIEEEAATEEAALPDTQADRRTTEESTNAADDTGEQPEDERRPESESGEPEVSPEEAGGESEGEQPGL